MQRNSQTMTKTVAVVVAALALSLGLSACGKSEESGSKDISTTTVPGATDAPQVSGAWARAAKAGSNSAIYLTIAGGSSADELLKATIKDDVADSVEIHETVAADSADHSSTTAAMGGGDDHGSMPAAGDDHGSMPAGGGGGMMTMREVEKIDVPAGGEVKLERGGYHIMLMNLHKDLVVGESLPVTLTFKNAGEIDVTAEIREG